MNALICLSISLKHVILDNWSSLNTNRRLELRSVELLNKSIGDNLLSYLADNGPKLNNLVVRNISIAICIISKLSWMEDRHQRSLLNSIENIIDRGANYTILGLNMMADLVEQMNIPYLSMDLWCN